MRRPPSAATAAAAPTPSPPTPAVAPEASFPHPVATRGSRCSFCSPRHPRTPRPPSCPPCDCSLRHCRRRKRNSNNLSNTTIPLPPLLLPSRPVTALSLAHRQNNSSSLNTTTPSHSLPTVYRISFLLLPLPQIRAPSSPLPK